MVGNSSLLEQKGKDKNDGISFPWPGFSTLVQDGCMSSKVLAKIAVE
jgi:hypothetical protein